MFYDYDYDYVYINPMTGTLTADGWAVTSDTARKGLGGLRPRPVTPCCTKRNTLPINGQCTNVISFDVTL